MRIGKSRSNGNGAFSKLPNSWFIASLLGMLTAFAIWLIVFSPTIQASAPELPGRDQSMHGVGSFVQTTAGESHTCALTTTGGVKCWGENSDGQLGDGTNLSSLTPVNVVGLANGVTAIAAGAQHTCALTKVGGMKCWGANGSGQLGDGTNTSSPIPANVIELLSPIAAIAAGSFHTCALYTDASVNCWGENGVGQLGLGAGELGKNWNKPPNSRLLDALVVAIAAGAGHTCVLTSVGAVMCWGANDWGQLGDGTTIQRPSPVAVRHLEGAAVAITAGEAHTCAVTTADGVMCWGYNEYGQLGDGTKEDRLIPVTLPMNVVGLVRGVTAIAAGAFHTCVVTTSSAISCWGQNLYGQLGDSSFGTLSDGASFDSSTPVSVEGLMGSVAGIAAGGYHNCALTTTGNINCWGRNQAGQLGDVSTTDSSIPVSVVNRVISIAAGEAHTCVLKTLDGVKCWGLNEFGQLGNNTSTSSPTPISAQGLASGVITIAAGAYHTCALTTTDGVMCWGRNERGQLGDGTKEDRLIPVKVYGLMARVSAIAAGGTHTCVLTIVGRVKCWGENAYGQLGDGTMEDRLTPVDVLGLGNDVIAISASYGYTCALTTTGLVKCWGYNDYDLLGKGKFERSSTPVDAIWLSDVAAITAGG